jgi:hypothetical protein
VRPHDPPRDLPENWPDLEQPMFGPDSSHEQGGLEISLYRGAVIVCRIQECSRADLWVEGSAGVRH